MVSSFGFSRAFAFASMSLGAVTACGSNAAFTSKGSGDGCEYGGVRYAPGESFPSEDGCNTCTCSEEDGVTCTARDCVQICTWMGTTYQVGESFPADDGCNTCACEPSGEVGCTLKACVTCTYGGATYQPTDSFPARDGCNTCTCSLDGEVSCTHIACRDCEPEAEWWRQYVATNPEECAVIDYACPPNTSGFQNACGCGCEQSQLCPESFDCAPPATCDVDKLMELCPYSMIAL